MDIDCKLGLGGHSFIKESGNDPEASDRVIVSMRKNEWVFANMEAVKRGPLSEDEKAKLRGWIIE